jgi:hypothetical protein
LLPWLHPSDPFLCQHRNLVTVIARASSRLVAEAVLAAERPVGLHGSIKAGSIPHEINHQPKQLLPTQNTLHSNSQIQPLNSSQDDVQQCRCLFARRHDRWCLGSVGCLLRRWQPVFWRWLHRLDLCGPNLQREPLCSSRPFRHEPPHPQLSDSEHLRRLHRYVVVVFLANDISFGLTIPYSLAVYRCFLHCWSHSCARWRMCAGQYSFRQRQRYLQLLDYISFSTSLFASLLLGVLGRTESHSGFELLEGYKSTGVGGFSGSEAKIFSLGVH